jgi:hypothetical protein
VAASSAVELAFVGPVRSATVVASTPHATYFQVADPDHTLICLASAAAVRVPCALILESKALPPQLPEGTIATVGGGVLSIGGADGRAGSSGAAVFRASRWWRPPRPRGLGAVAPARLAGAVRWLTGRVADPLDALGRAAVADLVEALAAGERPGPAVSRLLGRGPGLTPTGDDVLAGALVTLSALGSPLTAMLGHAVLAAAPDATTAVSAGLLRRAAAGECIPQLADVLSAVGDGGPDAAAGALPRAAGALLAVGHCSGAGLLHGVLVAVAIAHARLANGVLRLAPPSQAATTAAA